MTRTAMGAEGSGLLRNVHAIIGCVSDNLISS